jgi:hypothetical protein
MIGFKTEVGLRKKSGRIALPLASRGKGQPEVTRLILNPVVKDLLYSLACAGGLPSYSPTLEGAAVSTVKLLGCNPVFPGFRSSQVLPGSV